MSPAHARPHRLSGAGVDGVLIPAPARVRRFAAAAQAVVVEIPVQSAQLSRRVLCLVISTSGYATELPIATFWHRMRVLDAAP
jgi:hypothetical protein